MNNDVRVVSVRIYWDRVGLVLVGLGATCISVGMGLIALDTHLNKIPIKKVGTK